MEAHLRECIHGALDTFMHRNATFLAERLHASFPSEVRHRVRQPRPSPQPLSRVPGCRVCSRTCCCWRHATSARSSTTGCTASSRVRLQMHCAQPARECSLGAAGTSSPPCRYLFAVACVELLKLQDAELALRPSADGEVRLAGGMTLCCATRSADRPRRRSRAAPRVTSSWAPSASRATAALRR